MQPLKFEIWEEGRQSRRAVRGRAKSFGRKLDTRQIAFQRVIRKAIGLMVS
jgi:hypothetical protein